MKMKIITLSITAVVVVVLLATVLIPVIDDAKNDYNVNNGVGTYSLVTDGEVTVSYASDASENSFTINGVTVIKSTSTYRYYAPIITDSFVIVANLSGDTMAQSFNYRSNDTTGAGTIVDTSAYDVTVTISGHSATIAYDETTVTKTFTWIGYYSTDGNYVQQSMWSARGPYVQYFNNIDQIRGANVVGTTNTWFSFIGDEVKYGASTVTADYDAELVTGTTNVYTQTVTNISSTSDYTFTVDNSGTDYTVAPYFYLIPKTVEGTTTMAGMYSGILDAIPVMLIAALLLGFVAMIAFRRE